MSRIGQHPVIVPAGVTVEIDGHTVKVTGPKGTLERTFTPSTTLSLEDGQVKVDLIDGVADSNAQQGLTRTLINNMVVGVSEGFAKKLEMTGVGYRATLKGSDLDLSLGYSHPILYKAPENITFEDPHRREGHLRGAGRPGGSRDPQDASSRAVQGQGHPLRG